MANLKISLRKKGASSFEGGDKLLPETDWAYILNKPPTFVPDPHGHSIEDITGLQNALNGQITQAWVTANTRSKTWVPLWSEVTGLVDQLDGKAGAMHVHLWDSIQSKPTFATVATSGSYNDLSNKPTIPSIPSVMNTAEGNLGTATTQRTINALNLKSIILNHSPAGSRPASDVKAWAKADNKPSYTWSEIGSKPSVIIEGDARLTNARPASDVHGWAKAENRPTYDLSQIEETTTYKRVTQSEKDNWNLKQTAGQVELIIGNFETDIIIPQMNNKLSSSLKGSPNGLAELDGNGKVPSTQLPSFVDDVLEYTKLSSFPTTGESGKIYIDLTTNKTYRWGGSDYVVISETLALGETSSTAYRGDRGKAAYDHSLLAHAPSNAQKNSNITKAEIEAKLTGVITSHTHAYLANNHAASGVTSTKINNWDSAYADTNNASNANTANRIVKRDAYGNFAAGTVIANLTGTASGNLTPDSTLNPAKVAQNSSYRFVTDSDKNAWNLKQTAGQVELIIGNFETDIIIPALASKLSASAKGETGNKVLSYGSTFKVLQTLANGTVNERTMTMPSGVKPTFTELGYLNTEGTSTIAALNDYELFYVSIFFIASSLNSLENTVGGFIWDNSIPFSVNFFDHNQIANVFLNARVNGTSFSVDSNGEMPFNMISGSKGFSVTIYGVKFE